MQFLIPTIIVQFYYMTIGHYNSCDSTKGA